jgi:hypothetical protein
MKKITNREKVIVGFGVLITIGVLVYFFLWPVLMKNQSKSDLKTKQERLQSVEKLKAMEPMIVELEKNMREQLGYSQITFKRNSAEATIMEKLAKIANQSEIKEIERLDVKPEKNKKSLASLKGDQSTLKSTVDYLYMSQVINEKDNTTAPKETKPLSNNPTEEKDLKEKNTNSSEKSEKDAKDVVKDTKDANDVKDVNDPDETSIASGLIFPPIPKDIPEEAKQALVKFVQTYNGKTITSDDASEIVDSSGIKDEKESDRIKKRIAMYGNRVKEKKSEVLGLTNKLEMLQIPKIEDKAGKFTAKMVFKSEMGQLIKLLYNLQTSVKWVKVEGLQITMADRQKALLGVELSMTATVLYD